MYGYSEKVNAPRPIDGESDDKFVQSGKFDLVYMYIHETSVGSSSVTNPEPICKGDYPLLSFASSGKPNLSKRQSHLGAQP